MESLRARGIDEWSAICSNSFVPLRASAGDGFVGGLRHLRVGEVGVAHVWSTASVVYRPAALIASEPRDDVMLSIHLTGSGAIAQEGRTARLTPHTGAIFEADREYALRFDGSMSELVLQVPRARLGLRDGALRSATARVLGADSAGVAILEHLLGGIIAAGDAPPEVEGDLAGTAVELLLAALRPAIDGPRSKPQLGSEATVWSVRLFLQQHFADAELTIDAVARQHAVSRRHLESLFARRGQSPAAYLRGVRLSHGRQLLSDTPMTVSAIAAAVGFHDVNTFIRAFRRVHGHTPEEWRRSGRASGRGGAVVRP